jgi:opine dehydrogenase
MGVKMIEYREDQFFWKGSVVEVEFWAPFTDVVIPPIEGPTSVDHRYFSEDIPVGTVMRYHLARKFGIDVPIIESMVRVGSAICGKDFLKQGTTLEDLGLADLDKDQSFRYVRDDQRP